VAASILIIEDETAIADVLAYTLQSEGYETMRCTLGSEGLGQLRGGAHALAILDVGLPDMSGFEVCRQARTFTDIPILFLTARSDEVERIVGLEIGADDYVTKPFSPREVAARVRVILRRGTQSTAHPAPSASWFEVDAASARIRFFGTMLDLTRYEYLLLKFLLQHPGQIYSRDVLMDSIWRDALDTSDRTVDTHIKTLRAKLKAVRSDLEPIATHRGMGYSALNGTSN
jgi:two-component system, OmpR family, catabolic regulation response regulator CreB